MRVLICFAIAAALVLAAAAHAAPASINGRWVTKEKDAVVEISQCGAVVCGKIAKYLKTPPNGVDQRDINNPDKAMRSRKILGSAILLGLTAKDDGWRGRIYDPRNGNDYRAIVQRLKNGNLSVKGCLGPICQTQIWTPGS